MIIKELIRNETADGVRLLITVDANSLDEAIKASYAMVAESMGLSADNMQDALAQVQSSLSDLEIREMLRKNVPGFIVPFALDQLDFFPALEAQIVSVPDIVEGKDYSLEIEVKQPPILALSSYEPVEIEIAPFVFDERIVAEQIEKLVEKMPEYDELQDRTVIGEGDTVLLDIEAFVQGQQYDELTHDNLVLELGVFHMPYDFEKNIIGMCVDEQKKFAFEGPQFDELGQRYLLEVSVTVHIRKILQKHKAEVTDSWVKKHFPLYSSSEELKSAVRLDLYKKSKEEYNRQKEYLCAKSLAERIIDPIPDDYFEYARNLLRKDVIQGIESSGVSAEMYFAQKENDAHEHNLIIMMQARELVKRQFALDALFNYLNLQIDEKDIEAALHDMAPGHESETKQLYESMGRMYEVRQAASRLKASRWLSQRVFEPVSA